MFPEYVKPSEGGKEKMRRLRTKRAAALFLSAALVLELFGNFGSVTVNAAELFGTAGSRTEIREGCIRRRCPAEGEGCF